MSPVDLIAALASQQRMLLLARLLPSPPSSLARPRIRADSQSSIRAIELFIRKPPGDSRFYSQASDERG
jgi:hypothetical protein